MRYNIRGFHGGLGDQLMWSSFPEYLTSLGHEVYLYTGDNVLPIRNQEIKELVWDMNPFIKGETNEGWNCGDLPGVEYQNTEKCFIMNAEKMIGLPPKNSLPKIYYKPKKIGIKDCDFGGIIELSSHFHKYDHSSLIDNVRTLIAKRNDMKWTQLTSPHQANPILLPELPKLEIKSIFELCDVIANSRIFASTMSGQHSLGAAIQRINPHYEQYCFIPQHDWKWVMDSKKFVFPNIRYLQT